MEAHLENTGYISERIPIPAEWEQVFTYFYYAANHTEQPVKKKLLPTFQTILVFSFGNPAAILGEEGALLSGRSIVMGPLKKVLEYELAPGSEILVVNFRFDAFYRFFGATLKTCKELVKIPMS
ncbi:DUF6597 domain-containing transcriptional factor [Paraflavitalea speifideaquila]|uniref:DUF6597 domain-containing transcriptional factor n=1 Tax=Paraflavitalea speifideaquila TaxID=3076558 RepID=UPI0028E41957|nr:DUF6597 domain-containing transcriptional factor [Paraflavitalea speifideiaquila]